jgi:hypothetical protein
MKKIIKIAAFVAVGLIAFTSAKLANNTYFKFDASSGQEAPFNCLLEHPFVVPSNTGTIELQVLVDTRTNTPVRKESLPTGQSISTYITTQGTQFFQCEERLFTNE